MKRRYELTEDADADINALWLYIAQNRSLDTADRLADRIYDGFEPGRESLHGASKGGAHR